MSGLAGSELYPVTRSQVRGARANLSGVQKTRSSDVSVPVSLTALEKLSTTYPDEGLLRVGVSVSTGDRGEMALHEWVTAKAKPQVTARSTE